LLQQAPLDLALAHQAMALVVVVLAVLQAERLTPAAGVNLVMPAQSPLILKPRAK
jgi:heme a synthase